MNWQGVNYDCHAFLYNTLLSPDHMKGAVDTEVKKESVSFKTSRFSDPWGKQDTNYVKYSFH